MNFINKKVIKDFRSKNGKVGGALANMELMLLTTKGAKSGKKIIVPVVYTKEGSKFVIVASKGGSPTNPSWYYNLLAQPEITVEVGVEKFKVRVKDIKGKERDKLFEKHAKEYPIFNSYKERTTRIIPVLTLEKI